MRPSMSTAVHTRIKVLIADDHTILREVIRLLLGSHRTSRSWAKHPTAAMPTSR